MAKASAEFVIPMKALGVSALPSDPPGTWHGEIKFDGYRAIAVLRRGKAELWSRNHKPLDYPEVSGPLAKLKCRDAVLDGEIVALDSTGRSDFQILQGRDLGERPPIVYYLFDLIELDGRSLLAEPIETRRKALRKLLPKPRATLQISPMFDGDPAQLFAAAQRQGLEGIILKRAGSAYESDRRSGTWIKLKHLNEQELVIGGYTEPKASRQYFGSIVVGYRHQKKWIYAGKVGTGFDRRTLSELHARFQKLKTRDCPFANLPLDHRSRFGTGMTAAEMRTVTWLKPKLVAQIKFAEWTREGLLRQPVYLGLRKDKTANAIGREPTL